VLQGHTGTISAIDICESKNLLLSGSYDDTVKLWSIQTNAILQTFKDTNSVYDVAI